MDGGGEGGASRTSASRLQLRFDVEKMLVHALVHTQSPLVEEYERGLLDLGMSEKEGEGFGERNAGGVLDGIAVDAATDGREGDGAAAVIDRELEGSAVTAGEFFGLSGLAVAIDRPDRVDDMVGGQAVAGRDLRRAGE